MLSVEPFLTAYDPSDLPGGSIDPLGFERGYLFIAERILPGLTNAASRPSCLAAGDGRVTVEAAMDQVEAVFGERPDRATLWGPVQQLGAKILGDWIILELGKP